MDQQHGIFLEWVRTTEVGCHFARTLAKDLETAKWDGATVPGSSLDHDAVSALNAYFAEACGLFEAVHVLFPDMNTPTAVVGLIRALCATPNWKCVEVQLDCPHTREKLLVGLRWFLPDETYVNYVLGFGNFDPMPKTRRAPFTALVLRTGGPGRIPSVAHAYGVAPEDRRDKVLDRIPVHLADMPFSLPDDTQIAAMWRKTGELKQAKLKGDHMAKAAKAKVTFCLPTECRTSLAGCFSEVVELVASAAM
jgi:hypothetical protein